MESIASSIECNDLDKLCRVCLKSTKLTVELLNVVEMIEYCTNDKVLHFEHRIFDPKSIRFLFIR